MTVCRYSRLLPAAGLMLAVFAGAAGARQAQAPTTRRAAPMTVAPLPSATERVPVDPRITIGRLENGLRYYIRRNPRPAKRPPPEFCPPRTAAAPRRKSRVTSAVPRGIVPP